MTVEEMLEIRLRNLRAEVEDKLAQIAEIEEALKNLKED